MNLIGIAVKEWLLYPLLLLRERRPGYTQRKTPKILTPVTPAPNRAVTCLKIVAFLLLLKLTTNGSGQDTCAAQHAESVDTPALVYFYLFGVKRNSSHALKPETGLLFLQAPHGARRIPGKEPLKTGDQFPFSISPDSPGGWGGVTPEPTHNKTD